MDGRIVALRPVSVESTDYGAREYGLTPDEMESKPLTRRHPLFCPTGIVRTAAQAAACCSLVTMPDVSVA